MVDFSGFTELELLRPDKFGPLPGRTAAMFQTPVQPQAKPDFREVQALATFFGAGTLIPFVVPALPVPPEDDHPARFSEDSSIGGNWFEKVHILPRTRPLPSYSQIDFGNIISTVQDTFELFSALRRQTVTLSTFTNNAGQGVEVPDLPTLPYLQEPFTSILDPVSIRLSPLPLIVQATPDGPGAFDDSLDFGYTLGAGTRRLFVTGNRIAVVLVQPSGNNSGGEGGGFDEVMEFGTNIQPATNGKEKRDSFRGFPRQLLDWTFSMKDLDRQTLQALLFDWQSRVFGVPAWWEQVKITASVIGGGVTSTVATQDLTFVDIRVGGLAVVFKDNKIFDVLTIISKTANSVTFKSTIQNSYDVGDLVVPVRLAHAQQSVGAVRYPVTVEEFNIRFRVIDNHTGIPTADTSAFSSYDGKVFLDDCNLLIRGSNMSESFERRLFVFDGLSGLVQQDSPWFHGKRTSKKTFHISTRQQLYELRQLMLALRGPQISWWIPTFAEDLTASQDLITNNLIDIENMGYTRFIQSREFKKRFRITFTDGTSLIRIVNSAIQLSADEERLTLDEVWPVARTVGEIVRIEFLELSRFATDSIVIRHQTIIGRAQVSADIRTVNDLD